MVPQRYEPKLIHSDNDRQEEVAVYSWLKNLEEAGFKAMHVNDGEENVGVVTAEEALAIVFSVDDAVIRFQKRSPAKGKQYVIRFILGNSPAEVAADMSSVPGPWDDAVEAIFKWSEGEFA